MKKSLLIMLLIFTFLTLFGCSSPRTIILDVTAKTEKISIEKAYNGVTSVLVDKGFDIKVANKDIGLITTEYKQFASVESYGNPSFDLYLQLKIRIKVGNDKKVHIILTPVEKDVNRLNASAFTEHEMIILTPEEQTGGLNAVETAYLRGQILFNNVLHGISDLTGLGLEQFEYKTMLKEDY